MGSIEIMKEELKRLENERIELESRESLRKKIDDEKEKIKNLKPKSALKNLIDNFTGAA